MNCILKSERKRLIQAKIEEDFAASLEDLAALVETSESTVRRDLDELEAEGFLRRVHGGAEKIQLLTAEETIQEKSVKNRQAKQRLAEKAASFIKEGQVIFIDAGTTTEQLLDFLPDGVTVVTNSIHHAAKLVEKQVTTIMIGGLAKNSTDAIVGPVAQDQIAGLHFDVAFLGMNGVGRDGLTTPDVQEAAVKRQAIFQSRKAYVLADASKLGQITFAKVAELSQVSILTEESASAFIQTLKEETEVIAV